MNGHPKIAGWFVDELRRGRAGAGLLGNKVLDYCGISGVPRGKENVPLDAAETIVGMSVMVALLIYGMLAGS